METKWQPAKTAPCDGSEIIGVFDREGTETPIIVGYDGVDGWTDWDYCPVYKSLLYWMPLPKTKQVTQNRSVIKKRSKSSAA